VKRIIISRTDNLGDVILTLPMAGILKQRFPDSTIIFLGKKYTKPLVDACEFVMNSLIGTSYPASSIQHPCLSGRQAASVHSSHLRPI